MVAARGTLGARLSEPGEEPNDAEREGDGQEPEQAGVPARGLRMGSLGERSFRVRGILTSRLRSGFGSKVEMEPAQSATHR